MTLIIVAGEAIKIQHSYKIMWQVLNSSAPALSLATPTPSSRSANIPDEEEKTGVAHF